MFKEYQLVPFKIFHFLINFYLNIKKKKKLVEYKNMQIKENILFGNLLQVQECYHYVNEEQFLFFYHSTNTT